MSDLRVNNIGSDLAFDLKIMALDKQTTVRRLVIDILTNSTATHITDMGNFSERGIRYGMAKREASQ